MGNIPQYLDEAGATRELSLAQIHPCKLVVRQRARAGDDGFAVATFATPELAADALERSLSTLAPLKWSTGKHIFAKWFLISLAIPMPTHVYMQT
jgi:hypothetical protein